MKIFKAKDIVSFKTGKLDSNAAIKGGVYPFFTCSQETYAINSYAFDTECVLLAGNNAAGVFPLKYFKGKFNAYQRTYIIEPLDESVLDIKYFYYFLRPLLQTFQQQATGATTKFLTLKILNSLEVALPDITTQKKIAAILSAYDDLIENNKQRIKLLESMAEELYKEWFVRFRFPNWQNTEFEKGVPKGWETCNLESLGNVRTGKTPSTLNAEFYGGEFPFYKTPDMHNTVFVFDTEETLTEQGLNSQKSQIIEENSIMVTCIGTGGVTAIATKKGCTNQQINTLTLSSPKYLCWAFYTIKGLKAQIELFGATGATMTNLSKGKFCNLQIVKP
ncbi:MAG: restriction endonuclease subunit S, partial [Agitococcus sp.]